MTRLALLALGISSCVHKPVMVLLPAGEIAECEEAYASRCVMLLRCNADKVDIEVCEDLQLIEGGEHAADW